jgi:hypothetical protein
VAEDRQRNWGFFSGMVRGVSDLYEGSKILIFLSWAPTGVQLAPASPKLVEGRFSEVRGCRVLGSSGHCPRVRSVAKIFGPAKPLPLRVAIASPSNNP